MIGRKATVGLSLLCAFALCAFAAQSASAAKATNTTAFTCGSQLGNRDFEDPHCDNKVGVEKGNYGHFEIPAGVTTEVESNAEGTETKVPSTFGAVVAGVKVEIVCNTATTNGAANKSLIHNTSAEVGQGKFDHTFSGTIAVLFKECEVKKPTKCQVKEPIEVRSEIEGVEGLENKATKENETMGVEFKPDGKESAFAEITFQNKGSEKCPLNGSTFPVLGTTIATGAPNPKEKWSGATAVFEAGNEMGKLTFASQPATFTGTFTTRMAPKENPISLTTVT